MYEIPDAPWIKYADTNGVPPGRYSDEPSYRYRVETVEMDGRELREIFNDESSALDFYQQCVTDGVLTAECWRIDSDGDKVELIEYYEKEEEEQ